MGFDDVVRVLWGVVGLLDSPGTSIYWLYLLTAGVLAIALHVARRRSLRGALRYIAAPRVWLHRSVRHDLALFLGNTLLYSFCFVLPLHTLSTSIATATWGFGHRLLGPLETPLHGPILVVLTTVAVFAMADLAFFLAHLALHKLPFLWAFHKVHHSAPVLVPLTVFRRHPVDIVFDGAVTGVVLGVTHGGLAYLAGEVPNAYTIAGVNALLFVCLIGGFNLQHSHVPLSFGPLEAVLVSPAAHQIHHSDAPQHRDRNFGNMLSIWDRLLRTYVPTRERPGIRFGCEGAETHRSVLSLYVRPFVEATSRNRSSRRHSTGS